MALPEGIAELAHEYEATLARTNDLTLAAAGTAIEHALRVEPEQWLCLEPQDAVYAYVAIRGPGARLALPTGAAIIANWAWLPYRSTRLTCAPLGLTNASTKGKRLFMAQPAPRVLVEAPLAALYDGQLSIIGLGRARELIAAQRVVRPQDLRARLTSEGS